MRRICQGIQSGNGYKAVQNVYKFRQSHSIFARGFTLLEVLVALCIVGTALAASVRAVGSLSRNSDDLRIAMLASWSAENKLVEHRIAKEFPEIGKSDADCSQDGVHLMCEEIVSATPDPNFRKVEITVVDGDNPERHLFHLVNVIPTGL